MFRRLRREDGAAAMEFGLILPILMVLLTFVAPLVKAGYEYMVLQRAVSHGVRFATRADVNPRLASDGSITRRPSVDEVRQFVVEAASPIEVDPAAIVVSPNPRLALPGEHVEVTADYTVSYGLMGDVANAVQGAFFGGGDLLADWTVTVSARGREE